MYSLDNIDEYVIEECKKQIKRIYPEFRYRLLGASKDKTALIAEIDFPDGIFYFRVDERSISSAYRTVEDADRY